MSPPGTDQPPAFDVYAAPFVPSNLKAINEAPATVIRSTPVRWIDFAGYVSSFAGSRILQADPAPPNLDQGQNGHPTDPNLLSPSELVAAVYHVYFQKALVEETKARHAQCDAHALYQVPLLRAQRDPRPEMYWLEVPGLREMSLRIEVGDIVHLRQLQYARDGSLLHGNLLARDGTLYPTQHLFQHDAVVYGIDRLREMLILHVSALVQTSMLFNVSFTVSPGRLGALYRSVMTAQVGLSPRLSWLRSMLFPSAKDGEMQQRLNKGTIAWTPRDDMLNYEQIRAVDNVLEGRYGRLPYLISGPPGTGKTKSIVELAVQLVAASKDSHLLVCAPSDPAADTLTKRLKVYYKPWELLRLQAPSRSFPEVDDTILPFCHVHGDMFGLPPFKQFMRYKIVVTTCRDAELMLRACLSNADLVTLEQSVRCSIHPEQEDFTPHLHWTGLLIDETAQAMEPEALIPLKVVAPPENFETTGLPMPVFVMAGDQNQLGPRTASMTVTLQTSLFERLLDRPLYKDHPLARSKHNGGVMRPLTQAMLPILRPAFTNLIRNYRSHPAILAVPSASFYFDTLEPEGDQVDTLFGWKGWQGRRWPVLFAQNSGHDEIERDGGGWYNVSEAQMACDFAKSFIDTDLLEPQEICIMSPFSAQVKLLRNVARRSDMRSVIIGPLEAFQGLENKLVILCTTRTRDRFIEQDLARGLGVINEPKRFNVALTRAKGGLIVIGNSNVLQIDENWRNFMAFCHRNGLWQGTSWVGADAGLSTLVSRLERQLICRDQILDGPAFLSDGMRSLGSRSTEEDEVWRDGHAVAGSIRLADEDGHRAAHGASGDGYSDYD